MTSPSRWVPGDTVGWIARLGPRRGIAVSALSGAAAGLGQAPVSVEVAGLLGLLGGLLLFLGAAHIRRAAWLGWSFGAGYFAVVLNWIVEPFFVDAARHAWMAPFALILMAGGLALLWAAAFALARALVSPEAGAARESLAWAAAMGAAELARGWLFSGFPWGLAGYVWSESPALQWVSILGPYGLTAVTFLMIAVTWSALCRYRWPVFAVAAPLPFIALVLAGMALLPVPADMTARPVVRLVQPNAPQHEKWDPARAMEFYGRQVAFTGAPGEGHAPDLIVWPETAIPWLLGDAGIALAEIAGAAGGVPVALGVQRVEGLRGYNALALLGPGGRVEALYDKHRLVPFGEYIPFGHLARAVGLRSFAARDGYGYSAGPGPRVIDFGAAGTGLPLICYEAIFPRHVRGAGTRPDFLVQVTNDAWFGELSGPYQHLAIARVRAVEQGLPMIRVANTGISAVIDRAGRVLAQIPLGEAGFADHALPPPGPATIYARTGDWPAIVLILATLGWARWRRGRMRLTP